MEQLYKYAEVSVSITNKNVDKIFLYKIPKLLRNKISVGSMLEVPFGKGNRSITGYVVNLTNECNVSEHKLKEIISISGTYPVLSQTMLKLAFWMKEKYYTTLAECVKCILPKFVKDKTIKYASINKDKENINELIEEILAKNNQQSRVLKVLRQAGAVSISELKMLLGIAQSPITALEKKEIISINTVEVKRNIYDVNNYKRTNAFNPTEEQSQAIEFINQRLDDSFAEDKKKPILLHGVTGSGKTEIYLRIISEVIKKGRQAIVLVPEISLTPQTVSRFIGRFGSLVTVTHSRLSDSERYDQWKKAISGDISIMVGPRSAIFTPFDKLGCIIIDEEHEHTYKSETTPKYDAREVAEKLSELTGALVILGSATPSIESYYKASSGAYDLVMIKNRVNHKFPQINIVDMRHELEDGNHSIFSRALTEAIEENIKNRHQTILFLNRRGHSTFVSCRKCGYVMTCESCNVNYTYHIDTNKLVCHYCSAVVENPEVCPQCGMKFIRYFGAGTQKIEREAKKTFPQASIVRMDLDTTRAKNSHETLLKRFAGGGADILIGTQMIAKGLDFPNVTLVGVIAADLSLNAGDFRSAENSFQLLTQVSGRAGRADSLGNVYIQTYQPEHYSIVYAAKSDYISFYNHEIQIRKQMDYPPFTHIFMILFTGEDEKAIITKLFKLMSIMKYYNKKTGFELLGPSPALISKIKNQYRWRILVKGTEEKRVKNFVLYCIEKLKDAEELNAVTVNLTLDPSFIF